MTGQPELRDRGQPARHRKAAQAAQPTAETLAQVSASMRRDSDRWDESYRERTSERLAIRAAIGRASLANGHGPPAGDGLT